MEHERDTQPEGLRLNRIDEHVRLALRPPDDALLRRHFDAQSGQSPAAPLSPAEQRWVTTNLASNPSWQARWRQLEQSAGYAALAPPEPPLRPPHRRSRPAPSARRAATLLLAMGLLYGAVWAGGRLALPETYRWASLDGYESLLEQRSRATAAGAPDDFGRAASALLSAHRATLGLFPRYDATRAARADDLLQQAFRATNDPFQRAEIAFFLAKAAFMQGDAAAADRWLAEVEAQQVADYRDAAARLRRAVAEHRAGQPGAPR